MNMKRDITIDRFRGLLVALMILFGLGANFNSFGKIHDFSMHAPDAFEKAKEQIIYNDDHLALYVAPNLAFPDLSVCLFFLAIGFTIIPSYNRKIKKYGKEIATKKMYNRYISLIGIGSCVYTICIKLYDITISKISYPLTILSMLCYILFLLYLVFYAFKRDSIVYKKVKNILSKIIFTMGIYNIVLSLFNSIMLFLGLTEKFYGYWGVFEHIGCAGLIFMFIVSKFKDNSSKNRLICSIVMFLLFVLFHNTSSPFLINNELIKSNLLLIDAFPDGGVIGGFAYASVLMFLTVVGDYYFNDRKKFNTIFYIFASLSLILFICSCLSFNSWGGVNCYFTSGVSKYSYFNKESISPSYLLVDIYCSMFLFIFVSLFRNKTYKFDILKMFGRNAIFFYLVEFILIDILCFIIRDIPLYLALLFSLLVISILTYLAYKLYKKEIIIKL